jgi:hypothetical protein
MRSPGFLLLAVASTACGAPSATVSEVAVEDDTGDTGSVKPPDIILGDPFVAMVAATPYGSPDSTCVLRLEVKDANTGEKVLDVSMESEGRDWEGGKLVGGVLYQATATATDCNMARPIDPFTSDAFSGEEGITILMVYDLIEIQYKRVLQQTEGGDIVGGEVEVKFHAETTQDYVNSQLVTWGVETATVIEGATYKITYNPKKAAAEVLSTMSKDPNYEEGAPVWVEKPGWW